ncbi:MAG: hypothetical protein JO135_06685 [Candidatus Eremiobacteraeota bacterium]|nr:hypothetical protein [Candidatus Eremiobacteraeota bacterium]
MTSRTVSAWVLQIVMAAGVVFLILTVLAMLLYPGGRVGDPHSVGYAFFSNFFSDLGQTRTYGGHANVPSLILFCIALVGAAVAIALFFASFAGLFQRGTTARTAANIGSILGILAAICFVGVAATPWNLYLRAHNDFVQWAFRLYLLAVIAATAATLLTPRFPRNFAVVFGLFALLLAAYIALLTFGPTAGTAQGALVQATAQKIIVYASIITIIIQALSVQRLLRLSSA